MKGHFYDQVTHASRRVCCHPLSDCHICTPHRKGSVVNVVLVHGAFADGSGWKPVADILRKDGYKVSVAQPPMTSLEDDVAATKRISERQMAG